jgi:tetratricopeptide (TPR) repeat protein
VGNLAVHKFPSFLHFWTDPTTSSLIPENHVYRPLLFTFFSFCWALGGGSTLPFHLFKVGFHFLAAFGLYLIWKNLWSTPGWFPKKNVQLGLPFIKKQFRLTASRSAFVLALIFAVHPACSECVNYVSVTSSLLCALFYVWAYSLYLLGRKSQKLSYLWISLLFYFFSVATKEEGITLPAVVILTEFMLQQGVKDWSVRTRSALRKALPYMVAGGVLGAWIYWMHPPEGNQSRGYASSFDYFITQWRAYLWYMRIWVWPWDLNADNTSVVFSKSLLDPLVIQSAIGNFIILAGAFIFRKRYPAIFFGILWFYITITPASSVVVLAEAINEHRMYLAYIGFVGAVFTLVVGLLGEYEATLPNSQAQARMANQAGIVALAIFIGLCIGTQERNRVWANDENLWIDTVEKNPTSGRALNNLALIYLERGGFPEAIEHLKKCEVYWPTYFYCSLNLGIAYQAMGSHDRQMGKTGQSEENFKKSWASLQKAYELSPTSVYVHFYLGRYYEEVQADYLKATEHLSRSLELADKRHPAAEIRIASNLRKLKRYPEALETARHVLQLDPANEIARNEEEKIRFEMASQPDLGSSEILNGLKPPGKVAQ